MITAGNWSSTLDRSQDKTAEPEKAAVLPKSGSLTTEQGHTPYVVPALHHTPSDSPPYSLGTIFTNLFWQTRVRYPVKFTLKLIWALVSGFKPPFGPLYTKYSVESNHSIPISLIIWFRKKSFFFWDRLKVSSSSMVIRVWSWHLLHCTVPWALAFLIWDSKCSLTARRFIFFNLVCRRSSSGDWTCPYPVTRILGVWLSRGLEGSSADTGWCWLNWSIRLMNTWNSPVKDLVVIYEIFIPIPHSFGQIHFPSPPPWVGPCDLFWSVDCSQVWLEQRHSLAYACSPEIHSKKNMP